MLDNLLEREIAAAEKYLKALRWHATSGRKLSFVERSANELFGGRPTEAPRDRARRYLTRFEKYMPELTSVLEIPSALAEVESRIQQSNADMESMLPKEMREDNEARALLESTGLGTLLALDALMKDPDDITTNSALGSAHNTFVGLLLYKKVLDSEALQNRRDELLPSFLKDALTWDGILRKVEIRKRGEQLEKLYLGPLPSLSLFTTRGLSLTDIFSRQKRFLKNLISDLNDMQVENKSMRPSGDSVKKEIEIVDQKIRECDFDLRMIAKNEDMDDDTKDRRSNIVHQRREDLYEKLERLYREDQ